MSVQAMAWAIKQRKTTRPSARHLLLVLGNYADMNGRSIFPSLEQLVEDTNMNRRTVQKLLRLCERDGTAVRDDPAIVAAHIKRADRRPVGYRLLMDSEVIHRGGLMPPRRKVTGRPAVPDGAALDTARGGIRPPDPEEIRKRSEEGTALMTPVDKTERLAKLKDIAKGMRV